MIPIRDLTVDEVRMNINIISNTDLQLPVRDRYLVVDDDCCVGERTVAQL